MYGVEFAPTKLLADKAVSKIRTEILEAPEASKADLDPPASLVASAPPALSSIVFDGKLISAEWVTREFRKQSFHSLQIAKKTIISALAHDMLKDRGITIEYMAER